MAVISVLVIVSHPCAQPGVYGSLLARSHHNNDHLDSQTHGNAEHGSRADDKHLEVHLIQTDPASTRKGRQRIAHRDISLAIDNSRLNLALESGIKGNDGLLLRRQERSLYADQRHLTWQDEKEVHGQRDKPDNEGPPGILAVILGHILGVRGIPDLETEQMSRE